MLLFETLAAKKSHAKANLKMIVKLRENEFNPGEPAEKTKPKEVKRQDEKKKRVGSFGQKPSGLLENLAGFFTPVSLYVDGWGVYLKISPLRGNFEAELNYRKRKNEHVLAVPLSPWGSHRITAKVTATIGFGPDSKKIVLMDVDTVVAAKRYTVSQDGIDVICEYPGMGNSGSATASTIGALRRLINPKDTVKVYLISNENFHEPHYDDDPREVYVSARYTDEAAVIACHEESHACYQRMVDGGEAAKLKLIEHAYGRMLDAIRITTGADLRKESADGLSLWKKIRLLGNPVVKAFKEGDYPDMRWNAGHPWDHPTELFASATSVLRFYPGRFFYWLSMYDKDGITDQRLVDITREIAIDVVKAWGKKSPFAPIVYEKLGLPKP
ncbi:MAG: hypothetical protein NTX79_02990 [Candidatus Micrarchaeota archaeon]|nr:hypothetical protein [Candidatus Micrarchaeota archaeon]